MSYKEVDAMPGISVKTVDIQLYIALKKLNQVIQSMRVEFSQYDHIARANWILKTENRKSHV